LLRFTLTTLFSNKSKHSTLILIFEFIYCRMFRIVSIVLLFLSLHTSAQSYIGFDADNFNGIHGALFNPANIADSRTKIDINLISASLFTVNNYFAADFWKAITDGESFTSAKDIEKVGIDKRTSGVLNFDILGPSALVTINKKHAVGLTTRFRSLLNFNTVDGEVIDFFDTGLQEKRPIRIADVNFNGVTNNFAELGVSYAQVFKNDRVEFLKGGVTLKYLRGFGSGTAQLSDGVIFYNPADPITVFTRGQAEYSFSNNLDKNNNGQIGKNTEDNDILGNARGFGIDLGVVYEYRPKPRTNVSRDNVKEQQIIRHITTYKYKIGASILDIGYINYKNQRVKNYDAISFDRQTLLDVNSFNNVEDTFTPRSSNEDFVVSLPTRLRIEFDLHLNKKFFLNAASHLSLIGKKASKSNRYANQITVSPRYESKWFTAFLPVTATQYGGVQVGLGGRLGPVFIGTSGFFSRAFDKKTRAFDIYAGLKIPIYHKTPERKNLPKENEDPTRFNCTEGCAPVKANKVKKLKGYKGEFDGK